jgi:ATP-dependent DNA ligase
VRYLPLIDRKLRLRALIPRGAERLLYCDYMNENGLDLFRLACDRDLEGIVAKHKHSPYLPDRDTTWFKIRNRGYSQWNGRDELFERQ